MDEEYKEYKEYVRQYLIAKEGDVSTWPAQQFRSRFQHILRVCKWIERLTEGEEGLDLEALRIAAIFHDVGYEKEDKHGHAERGALIFEAFARERGFPEQLTQKVKYLIAKHSKKTPYEEDSPIELAYLKDADLLDEEGAMGIVWDCLVTGASKPESYEDALVYIKKYSASAEHLSSINITTAKARAIYQKKLELLKTFVEALEQDLEKEA